MAHGAGTWHTLIPAVYLDQWVWVRFARVVHGRPQHPSDRPALEAVMAAAERGVAFPLSTTHYEETLRVVDPRQRRHLVSVMAPASAMLTMRCHNDLIRHQMLVAMHEVLGRPAFQPASLKVFGLGVHWAFKGSQGELRVLGPDGDVQNVDRGWLRHASQFFEAQALAGPSDEDVTELRHRGYVTPRELEERPGNRLGWEMLFADRLQFESPSRAELRAWILGRELAHEYLDLVTSLLMEYRFTFRDITRSSDEEVARRNAVEFAELLPTLRIAADMKFELFRNRGRTWTQNMVRDMDALSVALPYCSLVVADRDAADLLRRSGAPQRYGSVVINDLAHLPEVLEDLVLKAPSDADPTGWDAVGPGSGFRYDEPPPPLAEVGLPPGSVVRYCGADGRPVAWAEAG